MDVSNQTIVEPDSAAALGASVARSQPSNWSATISVGGAITGAPASGALPAVAWSLAVVALLLLWCVRNPSSIGGFYSGLSRFARSRLRRPSGAGLR
ncbi:MAG: hypothetical protein ABSG92_04595 [Conexivisphaerales archaeon]